MNDQSFLLGDADDRTGPPPHSQGGRPMTNRKNKRFRRGVSNRATGSALVAHTDGSLPVSLATNTPLLDEWDTLPLAPADVQRQFLPGSPLVNYFRRDPGAKAFDLLRTRLLQALRAHGWGRIAIASPTEGCGTTFTAINLAQSLARIPGSRTVLMDLNHRNPGIAATLNMQGVGDMRGFLAGNVPMEQHLVRASKTLGLGLISAPDDAAAEILHDARSGETLDLMTQSLRPDVVIYDLPPILEYDDLAAFLPHVDGVLMVADGTRTTAKHIAACERTLKGQSQLLGIILNRARTAGGEDADA
ncbi:MAG: exopolysaccharide biosynthesis protein [Rhodobacteraceae bacterium]|nr:MAG: exopolysaccharide biosynthesis protein [Paracoccaceae bacterium]